MLGGNHYWCAEESWDISMGNERESIVIFQPVDISLCDKKSESAVMKVCLTTQTGKNGPTCNITKLFFVVYMEIISII